MKAWRFVKRHRSKILTWIGIGMPIAVGVVTGGVTLPAVLTAIGAFSAKLAASPIDHTAEREADVQRRLERIKRREGQP